jgi:hypothetical protein
VADKQDSSPTLPSEFQANAWTGDIPKAASAEASSRLKSWILQNAPPSIRTFLKPPEPADPRDWRDPRVGWGLILAEPSGLTPEQLATADDAPEPIRQLVKDRLAPVFRYRPGWQHSLRFLRDYANGKDVAVSGSPAGTGIGQLPRYLLIYGPPDQVPWDLQYILNASCGVGRLDLTGVELENYITALRSEWKASGAKSNHSVVWAVNHGGGDITELMRDSIANEVYKKLAADVDIGTGAVLLDSAAATSTKLIAALAAQQPGLVVTTSHGMTGPLGSPNTMRDQLGFLVDQEFSMLKPDDLKGKWEADGAIWYAHACCSAGSDSKTLFKGLVNSGSEIDQVLQSVASLGAAVAPFPRALLGSKKPLRAFVGHVEPTFDWTLRQPPTGQTLTDTIQRALYDELFRPAPLGHALRETYGRLGALYAAYDANQRLFNEGGNTRSAMLYNLLAARDIQSLVILGDPTAMLSPLQ